MSGIVTGWVGQHGPHPDDIDRNGVKYGNRARGLRMVLLAVADAANVDGLHAHPGVANVARFTLYSSGGARRLLEELEAEGWLIVTEQGTGRGRATVYQVPMGASNNAALARRASCAPSPDVKARMPAPETRAPAPETRASEPERRASRCAPNGLDNGATEEPTTAAPKGRGTSPEARAIATAVWEGSGETKPATPFIAVAKVADALLTAGHAPDAITAAMLQVPTISTRWVEADLRKNQPRRATPVAEDRAAPSGRVAL